jgi:DNA polymerase-3 subunit alpha
VKVDRFVHLHTHSDRSHLDGCGKLEDYVRVAAERGHKAIAFTEHGTLRGIYDLAKEARRHESGPRPIYGIEAYVCRDMTRRGLSDEEIAELTEKFGKEGLKAAKADREAELETRKIWHTTIWARTQEGLKNLFRLSSKAYLEGYYYKPRIDLQTLIEHKEGLAVATGCAAAPVPEQWLSGRKIEAMETAQRLYDAFGSDLWLEVMPHNLTEGIQHGINDLMVELRTSFTKCRLLATQDSHYIDPAHTDHHEVLLCIGTGKKMSDGDRFVFDPCGGFHFRTRAEMEEEFRRWDFFEERWIQEACDSTLDLAASCDAELDLDPFRCLLPPVDLPEVYGEDHFAYIRDLAKAGWEWRDIPGRAAKIAEKEGADPRVVEHRYIRRLSEELRTIQGKGFVPYFLIVRELYEWARGKRIMVGPGRGSSAGSLVAFLLGITAIDPIEFGLLFERFISPARLDMPDIDMDFEDARRGEIIGHLREKYGADHVARIATMSRLTGKSVVKAVCQVYEVPFVESNRVTSEILERSEGDERAHRCVEDSLAESETLQRFDTKWGGVLRHAVALEGLAKNPGIHAAGVVTSPVPLIDVIPLETRKQANESDEGRVVVTALDMFGVGEFGLLKLDVLGLRYLSVIRDALDAIEERTGERIDPERLELDDELTLTGFTEHDFTGVFQFDSPAAHRMCQGVSFERFDTIAAMNALNRPGTSRSGLADEYKKRLAKGWDPTKHLFHPKVTEITSDTLGVIVYQEHVIRIARDVAGYDAGAADKLRKTIGKRLGEEALDREREQFVRGCMTTTTDMRPEVAERLMDAIAKFGAYSFNKSHAVAYSVLAYWCMWLKRHHPLEFYFGLIRHEPDAGRMRRIAREAVRKGVDVRGPDVNRSNVDLSINFEEGAIRGGLSQIKYVGAAGAAAIAENRPYADFGDFAQKIGAAGAWRAVTKRVVESLAKAGAFQSIHPNPRGLFLGAEDLWSLKDWSKRKGLERAELFKRKLKTSEESMRWDDDVAEREAAEVSPFATHAHATDALEDWVRENVKHDIPIAFDDPELWTREWVWVYVAINESVAREVGEWAEDKDRISAAERARRGFGEPFRMLQVEDATGVELKCKVDAHIYPCFSPMLDDAGAWDPFLILAEPKADFRMLGAHTLINVADMKRRADAGEPLNVWERIALGHHPALGFPWKSAADRREAIHGWPARDTSKRRFRARGVVAHVRARKDRSGHEMATFHLVSPRGLLEVLCFRNSWPAYRKHIQDGALVTMELEHMVRGDGYALDSSRGRLVVHKTEPLASIERK